MEIRVARLFWVTGLVSNNVGGTKIESWLPREELAACETVGGPHPLPPWANNETVVDSRLWGAMVHPYTVGPMALSGIACASTWSRYSLSWRRPP